MRKWICGFTTAGSVDDGKSTLIGRLLYDSKNIFEDQIQTVEESSKKRGDVISILLCSQWSVKGKYHY